MVTADRRGCWGACVCMFVLGWGWGVGGGLRRRGGAV